MTDPERVAFWRQEIKAVIAQGLWARAWMTVLIVSLFAGAAAVGEPVYAMFCALAATFSILTFIRGIRLWWELRGAPK